MKVRSGRADFLRGLLGEQAGRPRRGSAEEKNVYIRTIRKKGRGTYPVFSNGPRGLLGFEMRVPGNAKTARTIPKFWKTRFAKVF